MQIHKLLRLCAKGWIFDAKGGDHMLVISSVGESVFVGIVFGGMILLGIIMLLIVMGKS